MGAALGGAASSFGVLFDVDDLGGGLYGYKAYKALFGSVDARLLHGSTLWDGDTSASLAGQVNQYCIRIDARSAATAGELRASLSRATAAGFLPPASRFLEGAVVQSEPLVQAATITSLGAIQGDGAGWLTQAWTEVNGTPPVDLSPSVPSPAPAPSPVAVAPVSTPPPEKTELVRRVEVLNQRLKVVRPQGPTKHRFGGLVYDLAGTMLLVFAQGQGAVDVSERTKLYATTVQAIATAISSSPSSHEANTILLKILVLVTRGMGGLPLPADSELDGLINDVVANNAELKQAVGLSKSGCFIATAAYGSDQAEDVVRLRQLRDMVLVRRVAGRLFVGAYLRCSPPIAAWIAERPRARRLTRQLVVRPARRFADWLLD